MKKIINGKLYDTESATEIAQERCEDPLSTELVDVLYVTHKGRFFTYSKSWETENSALLSESMSAIPSDQALYLVEQWDVDPDTVVKHFEIEEA